MAVNKIGRSDELRLSTIPFYWSRYKCFAGALNTVLITLIGLYSSVLFITPFSWSPFGQEQDPIYFILIIPISAVLLVLGLIGLRLFRITTLSTWAKWFPVMIGAIYLIIFTSIIGLLIINSVYQYHILYLLGVGLNTLIFIGYGLSSLRACRQLYIIRGERLPRLMYFMDIAALLVQVLVIAGLLGLIFHFK